MTDALGAGRAPLPGVSGGSRSELDALQLALRQAVVSLRGLGGMIHLGSGGDRMLRLTSAVGIPLDTSQAWQHIDRTGKSAPALALRDDTTVWLPSADTRIGLVTFATGVAAVPLPASKERVGALCVVTATSRPPTAAQWAFLEAIARLIATRLRKTLSPPSPPPAPAEQPARSRFQQAVGAAGLGVGVWDWDIRSGDVVANETLLRTLGMDPTTFDGGVESWAAAIHPEDLVGAMTDLADAFLTRVPYSGEYRLRCPDDTVRWVQVHGRVTLGEDGEPTHLTGTLQDSTGTRTSADLVVRALQSMREGFVMTDPGWRVTYVNIQARRLLSPSRPLLGRVLWEEPTMRSSGLEAGCRQAVAEGSPADFEVQWPTDQRWYRIHVVPSPEGPAVLFTDVTEHRLLDAERLATERVIEERGTRIGLLTTELGKAVSVRDVVHAIAAGLLPPFGAVGLIVQLVEGEFLRVVGAVGYPREFTERITRSRASEFSPNADVLRVGAPLYLTSQQDFMRRYPDVAGHAFGGGKHAWAFLPLIVSGRPIGCCVVSFAQSRRFSEEERALLTAVSGLIAQALERARLYDAEHGRATELQRGLLPRVLPQIPAVTTVARYLPAGSGDRVGGDWYDVIPLSADRVALVIGDVMGHGISEAATMGRLRTAVHTLASLELPPDELLDQLNDLVSDLGDDLYATCLYAVYDPVTRVCTVARAGHPPPALVLTDGTVHFPGAAPEPPLGAASPPFETAHLNVPDGSLLVLYTDGLVESATRDVDSGMEQLAAVLAASADGGRPVHTEDRQAEARSLGRLCDELTAALLPREEASSDDAAVLVARTHALPSGNVACWELPDGPIAAGQAREYVRAQLSDWHLDDMVATTEVLVSELVGNSVRHAQGPIGLRLLQGRALTCEVSDHSLTTPRVRRARDTDEGGRGLQLVAALSQRWGTRYTADGKRIWTEQALPAAGQAAWRTSDTADLRSTT